MLYCRNCDNEVANFDCLKVGYPTLASTDEESSGTDLCHSVTSLGLEVTEDFGGLSLAAPNFGYCPAGVRPFVSRDQIDVSKLAFNVVDLGQLTTLGLSSSAFLVE